MKVVWTYPAEIDLEEIFLYIARDNPDAAIKMDKLFTSAADSLRSGVHKIKKGLIYES